MRFKTAVLAILLSLVSTAPVWTQPASIAGSDIRFARLGSQSGLSHNTVLSILQDRQGFLWIGTADGLNRYDGYGVDVHRFVPGDPSSLPDNTIRALLEDHAGRLWVATSVGVSRLDRTTRQWLHYSLPGQGPSDVSDVQSLHLDDSGTVWAQDFEHGLFRYDNLHNRFVRFRLPDEGSERLEASRMMGLLNTSDRSLWLPVYFDSSLSILRFDGRRDKFVQSFDLRTVPIRPREDSPIGTGRSGMIWLDSRRVQAHVDLPVPIHLLPTLPVDARIRDVLVDRTGSTWIGTDDGIYTYSAEMGLRHHVIDTLSSKALSNYVWQIYEDRAGTIWIGTRGGLYRYDPHAPPLDHLVGWGSLLNGTTSIYESPRGKLWVGTFGNGLIEIDLATGRSRSHGPGTQSGVPSDVVWSVLEDADGTMWAGTEAGLYLWNGGWDGWSPLPLPLSGPDTPPAVYAISNSDNRLLLAGHESVYIVDPHRRVIERRIDFPSNASFTSVQTVHATSQGEVWIGTEGAGLWRFEPNTGSLIQYPHSDGDRGLPGRTIWSIFEDAEGIMWLGTDIGLVRVEPMSGEFTSFYDPVRMPGAVVYSVLEDDRRRLWLGTNSGLVRFDIENGTFRHYSAADGLRNTEFNRRAVARTSSGAFLFGGLDGISVVYPDETRENDYVPPIAVTNILRTNRSGTFGENPELGVVVMRREDTSIEFEYSALSFTNPQQNQYAYRLTGIDAGWMQAGTRRTARYTMLPPGRYQFLVRGANNDGVWNNEAVSIAVVVEPKLWQTWWFRGLLLLLFLAVAAGAYRYRIAQVVTLERLRLRIADDLHDDVASKLSSVALLAEMVRDRAELSHTHRSELTKASKAAREIVEELRDIVWFVDPTHEKSGQLVARMRQISSNLLPDASISFRCDQPDVLDRAEITVRRNIYLIFKEIVHNIARHAGAGRVEIAITSEGGAVHVTVHDDGAGFDSTAEHDGHGLLSMNRRAAQLGAELTISSNAGSGTEVRLTAKIT